MISLFARYASSRNLKIRDKWAGNKETLDSMRPVFVSVNRIGVETNKITRLFQEKIVK